MNSDSNQTSSTVVACHKCNVAIVVPGDAGAWDPSKCFVRLRCGNLACDCVDWYGRSECEEIIDTTQTSPPFPGGVWVHDSLLGLSFKDPDGRA